MEPPTYGAISKTLFMSVIATTPIPPHTHCFPNGDQSSFLPFAITCIQSYAGEWGPQAMHQGKRTGYITRWEAGMSGARMPLKRQKPPTENHLPSVSTVGTSKTKKKKKTKRTKTKTAHLPPF